MMNITDSVTLGDAKVSPNGYLEANARTARTGVQKYAGAELGRPDIPVVNVYRDEADVFSKVSLDTFSRLPITNDHPAGGVTVNSQNWKDLAVGTTGDEVLRDGEYLKVGLKITDASAVQAVTDGKRELSVGYTTDIVWQDGIAPDGTPYQAMQKNIVANHIAIVQRGRAGQSARIGDSWGTDFQPGVTPSTVGGSQMTDQLKTVVLGDKAVQVAVADEAAIVQYKADMQRKVSDAEASKKKLEEEKDEEIGKLKADLKKAQDAAIVDVDALVAARTDLVSKVTAIDSAIEVKGKTDAELRKAAVASKLGDALVADSSEAEINGMFKAISTDSGKANPVAAAIQNGVKSNDADAMADAQSGYVARLTRQKKEG